MRIHPHFMLPLVLLACTGQMTDDSVLASDTDTDPDTDADTDTDTDTDSGTDSAATWSGNVYSIEQQNCQECHSSWGRSSSSVYTAWTTLSRGDSPFVTPGDPSRSYLYLKLTADPPDGATMPYITSPVNGTDLAALRSWIESGAANDEAYINSMARIFDSYQCDDCHSNWAGHGDTDALYRKITTSTSEGYAWVDPGSPDTSYIYLKVSSDAPPKGSRMPQVTNELTSTQIGWVEEWITAGALDN